MIWLNSKKLEKQITSNELTEKDSFYYLLATVLYNFAFYFYSKAVSHFTILTVINFIVSILGAIIVIPMIYKINREYDDKDFIKRFFAITWIVRIKLTIIMIVYTLIYMTIFKNMQNARKVQIVVNIIMNLFLIAINYLLTIQSFKRLKSTGQKDI
jgi:uncharacterized membrane protein